jgi:hypothetical protein
MKRFLMVCGIGLLLVWFAPAAGFAKDDDEGKGNAGGVAAEHRSERADERSNAQWSEGATRGQERAAEQRGQGSGKEDAAQESEGEESEQEGKDEKEKANKKAKGGKGKGKQGEAVDD